MPVKVGEIHKIEIIDIGNRGEGIGKIDNFTVFVDEGVPGDLLKVKIYKKKKSYAKGEMIEIIEGSDIRIEPPCIYYDDCGGCQIQDIKYAEQLKLKNNKVKSAIERIGKIKNFKLNETIGMDEPFYYRNKGQFPIQKEGTIAKIGFYKIGSHAVVDIKECMTQDHITNAIVEKVRAIVNEFNISIYDENKHKGRLRHLLIRTAYNTNETMVVFVTKGNQLPFKNTFVETLSEIDGVKSIIHNINNNKGNRVLGYENETIYGKDKIIDTIGDIKFEISPLSFYQINPVQTKKLYDQVKNYAKLMGEEVVLDLFCGIGTIGLYLANNAQKVIGVEVVKPAVEDARKNAIDNQIENIEFFNGKAEEVMPKLQKDGLTADIVIVDPPRKGCDEKLLETIKTINPKKVIYVSCKPSTLARDLKYLSDQYQVVEVQPVDMFPQTTHIENVALLIRK